MGLYVDWQAHKVTQPPYLALPDQQNRLVYLRTMAIKINGC